MTIEDHESDVVTFAVLLLRKLQEDDSVRHAIAKAGLIIEYNKALNAVVRLEAAEGNAVTDSRRLV